MHVDVIDTYVGFARLEHNWNELYCRDPDAQLFLSWSWLSWVFREHPGQWRVLAVKPDARAAGYLAFFPVRLKTIWSKSRRRFRNEIHMAGRLAWAQYTGFLCDPDYEEEVMAGLAMHLKGMRWSRLSLKYVQTSARRIQHFLDQFSSDHFEKAYHELTINKGETNNLVCPYVELPNDLETYLRKQLSANTRQKIRRFMRQFEESDDLRITVPDAGTIEEHLDVLIGLWIESWSDSKGRRAEELGETYRLILENSFSSDALHLPVLWRGDEPLGALGHLVDWQKRRLFFIVAGRDQSRPEPFVGWVLHAHSIRWAIENGFAIYDFCHGDEAYKYSYGAKDRHVKYATIRTRSGVNLHEKIDPACIGDVMMRTIRFLETDRLQEARIACRQVYAATQPKDSLGADT